MGARVGSAVDNSVGMGLGADAGAQALNSKPINKTKIDVRFIVAFLLWRISRLTVSVTRGWAGRGNAVLTEPASSRANCLKTRRLPPVGCTLC